MSLDPGMGAPAGGGQAGAMTGESLRSSSPDPIQSLVSDVQRLLATLGGPVQFASMVPRGNRTGWPRFAMFEAGDPSADTFVARSDAEGRSCYYSLNIVRPGLLSKASKGDIVALRGAHADIDPPKDGARFDREGKLALLRHLPIVPTFIIDSGGGLQPVWLFEEPVFDFELVESVNRALIAVTDGDNCFNVDRLLRVPGSLNTPDVKKAAAGRVPRRACFVS